MKLLLFSRQMESSRKTMTHMCEVFELSNEDGYFALVYNFTDEKHRQCDGVKKFAELVRKEIAEV
ncbi:unnamed protein product [Enterobius vermicularis]|uniref:Conserved domain protein n=1 Tax=Enterobius vermicularis TaxID=51028 RepID=A0A0N4VEV8_ENTVE|nr:unnamed protein product [Enterobius vermicularis]